VRVPDDDGWRDGDGRAAGTVWSFPPLIAICVAVPATIVNDALVTVSPEVVARSV